nr:MAG TPA: hypothetical protein [Caudoviricetes sp.]
MTFPTTLRLASRLSTIASRLITIPLAIRLTTAPPISPAINAARSSSSSSRSITHPHRFFYNHKIDHKTYYSCQRAQPTKLFVYIKTLIMLTRK